MNDTTQLEKVRAEMVRRHENDLERAAQRIAELEAQLAAERESKQHETERAQTLMRERNKLRGELDLSNEAIGLVRQHLQSVGISAEFVDDAAAIAAYRLNVVRQSRARLVDLVRMYRHLWKDSELFLQSADRELAAAREDARALAEIAADARCAYGESFDDTAKVLIAKYRKDGE